MLSKVISRPLRRSAAGVALRDANDLSASRKINLQLSRNTRLYEIFLQRTFNNKYYSSSSTPALTLGSLMEDAKHFRTFRDLLRYSISKLTEHSVVYGQGSTNAHEDALWLILGSLHIPLISHQPAVYFDSVLTPAEISKVMNGLYQRIVERKPTGYIVKRAVFGDYEFYVDERAIIPRSLIAEVLTNEEQLQEKLPSEIRPNTVSNCLDMCTGSGALAIVLADVFPEAKIDAVDTSSHALEVARVNINNHRLNDTIELVLSDMFHSIRDKRYDVIVSNPPYVTKKSLDAFPEEFKKEPALAHFGGNDGLNFVELLLKEAPRHLTENGILIVEAGNQRSVLERRFPDIHFEWLNTSVGDEDVFMVTRRSLTGAPAPNRQGTKRSGSSQRPSSGSGRLKPHSVDKRNAK